MIVDLCHLIGYKIGHIKNNLINHMKRHGQKAKEPFNGKYNGRVCVLFSH